MEMSIRIRVMVACSVGVASACLGQGTLTPPGAPGATMKTLDQVQPRTPIPSGLYTIS